MSDAQELQKALNYLGSCHAATLEYDCRLSHTSKSSIRRFVSVGRKFLDHMTAGIERDRLVNAIKHVEAERT